MSEGHTGGPEHQQPVYTIEQGQLRITSVDQAGIRLAQGAFLKPKTNDALMRTFASHGQEDAISLNADHLHFDQENVGDMLVLSTQDIRVYLKDGEIVYSSELNGQPRFASLAGFLSSSTGKNVVLANEHEIGPAADVALFGTINSNLQGVDADDWMGAVQQAVENAGLRAFNPNKGVGVQSSGIDMKQFAKESQNLFDAPVVVMNFEPQRGGLALAELRMAMLASALTGHKLLVRMERPHTSKQVMRSRAVAIADIEFFREHMPELQGNMQFYDIDELTLPQFAQKAIEAAQKMKGHNKHGRKLPLPKTTQPEKVVLSGSSADARDIAMRLELKHQMRQEAGIEVIDTYTQGFSGDRSIQTEKQQFESMKQNRKEELETMNLATDHIVYAGGSLSPFGQLTTALLFSVYNGSSLRGLVLNPDLLRDVRDSYTSSTYRSHVSKAAMNYQLAKIMNLLIESEGVAPELQAYIPIVADAIDPVVDSFQL